MYNILLFLIPILTCTYCKKVFIGNTVGYDKNTKVNAINSKWKT